MLTSKRNLALILLPALLLLFSAAGCAPRQPYRSPLGPRASAPSNPVLSETAPPTRTPDSQRPGWEEARIREPAPQPRAPEPPLPPALGRESAPSPLPDDSSLIAKITPTTSPRRAASLRLTEEGKKLIEAGQYAKALIRLEKTIAIDSTNAYGYYYLAKTHYHLGRYQESLNFLDVAESRLVDEPYWLAEVYAMKGENYRALGFQQRAESSYSKALQWNPGNRTASDALARMPVEAPSPPR